MWRKRRRARAARRAVDYLGDRLKPPEWTYHEWDLHCEYWNASDAVMMELTGHVEL